ncbi:MAG: hypothetical protein HQM04_16000 [Magnetococcales bacterium]|nr:hypothetical protein [Magnetococcales bacterium]MBF0116530.1 hypothetical protein [Magnetococcales bacterium]
MAKTWNDVIRALPIDQQRDIRKQAERLIAEERASRYVADISDQQPVSINLTAQVPHRKKRGTTNKHNTVQASQNNVNQPPHPNP